MELSQVKIDLLVIHVHECHWIVTNCIVASQMSGLICFQTTDNSYYIGVVVDPCQHTCIS